MSCTVLQGAFLPHVTILVWIEDLCSADQFVFEAGCGKESIHEAGCRARLGHPILCLPCYREG
jgi:hypothetical protein